MGKNWGSWAKIGGGHTHGEAICAYTEIRIKLQTPMGVYSEQCSTSLPSPFAGSEIGGEEDETNSEGCLDRCQDPKGQKGSLVGH